MTTTLRERIRLYAQLTRLDRPIGISLLLWPTLCALWVAARGWPGAGLLAIFVAGTALTRSAGCAVNDYADRDFDGHVGRTAGRVLARGLIAPREALLVAAALAALAALTLPFLTPEARWLALAAAGIAVAYPFFKRFFPLPQAWLGIAFSFGIPMAFAAVRGEVGARGWELFCANLFWVMAYDTEYAMVDRRDDLRIGIRSSAILFGRRDVPAVGLCYAIYLGAMAWLLAGEGAGWPFTAAWLLACTIAVRHIFWIRTRDEAQCLRAFRDNHWLGFVLFVGVALTYAL
jgi:4-hydroxybenzoate polyprenyltransferase